MVLTTVIFLTSPPLQGRRQRAEGRRKNVTFYTILRPLSCLAQIGSKPPPYRRLVVFNQWGFKPLLYFIIPSTLCPLPFFLTQGSTRLTQAEVSLEDLR